MKRSQRLQVVVDLKANGEKKCLENLAFEQMNKQKKEAQINDFKNYRQEWVTKNSELLKKSVSISVLKEYQAFIMKIDEVIKSEDQSLIALQDRIIQLQDLWKKAHLHTKNMQKIQTQAKLSEQKEVDKQEQLEMDEHASRKRGNGINNA